MRFRLGKPPDAPELQEDQQIWHALELPHALILQLFALPLGVLIAYGLLLGWSWTPSHELSYSVHGFADVASVLLAVVSFLVIHEVLHCLAHPGFGGSRQSVIGLDATALLPYAAYLGPMSRSRTILVLLTPLLLLSVLPLLICLVGRLDGGWLAVASIVSGFGSGGDLVIVALVLLRVPRGALMRDSGWKMWWKAAAPSGGEWRAPRMTTHYSPWPQAQRHPSRRPSWLLGSGPDRAWTQSTAKLLGEVVHCYSLLSVAPGVGPGNGHHAVGRTARAIACESSWPAIRFP